MAVGVGGGVVEAGVGVFLVREALALFGGVEGCDCCSWGHGGWWGGVGIDGECVEPLLLLGVIVGG